MNGPVSFVGVAYAGGKLRVPGCPLPVVIDLAGLRLPGRTFAVLYGHDPRRWLGHTRRMILGASDLSCLGVVEGDSRDVAEVLADRRAGAWQMSVRATVLQRCEVVGAGPFPANGRAYAPPFLLATRTVLHEVSIVRHGEDPETSVIFAGAPASAVPAAAVRPPARGAPPLCDLLT